MDLTTHLAFLHEYGEDWPLLQEFNSTLCLVTTLKRILPCCLKGISNSWTSPLWNPTTSQLSPSLMKIANNKHLLNQGEKTTNAHAVLQNFFLLMSSGLFVTWLFFFKVSSCESGTCSVQVPEVLIFHCMCRYLSVLSQGRSLCARWFLKEGKHSLPSGVN